MDRMIWELNENWRFYLGECEQAWYKGYDDSAFREVTLPHDWSVELPFSETYSSGTGYLAGGTGWYRVRFHLPEKYQGKSIRLVFDGVYKNSQVWCNSYYLGKRPYGYTEFSYDISSLAVFGEQDNEVSVKVTHTDIADSRWFTGSGITRKVSLLIEEPVHPVMHGCFFQAEEISFVKQEEKKQPLQARTAYLTVKHKAVNDTEEEIHLETETIFLDREGNRAAGFYADTIICPGKEQEFKMEGCMEGAWLWSPENPYLYIMQTYYRVNGKEKYLADEQKVGIRRIRFDAEKGFYLNEVETKLKGVCVHHDGGCLGAAMKKEVWQRRLELLKKCGCNAVRCSHNPHMPELYELCDALGFLVMDEAFDEWENPKNKWSAGHNVYPPKHQGYYEDFPVWHEEDIKTMVRRDRNHPSVIMWSIGNEIDYPNDPYCHPMFTTMTGNNDADKPEEELRYDRNKPGAERLIVLARRLAEIVRQEDESRPVTQALAFPELYSRLGIMELLDVAGYNYKEHLYEEDHKRFPGVPLLGSENGHSKKAWEAVLEYPYICGQFLWTGIDYLGEAKGWPVHGSPAGLLTTAGFQKAEYYRRRSFWSEEPCLYLASAAVSGPAQRKKPVAGRWNYTPGEKIRIYCFAGGIKKKQEGRAEFFMNGKLAGCRNQRDDGAFVFETDYEPGVLTARWLSPEGSLLAENSLMTTSKPVRLFCELWQERDAVTGNEFSLCSGQKGYLYQLLLCLKDEKDRTVVWSDRKIRVRVQGAGELAGMDNGNLSDIEPFSEEERMTFEGRLAVYVRRTGPGRIEVSAECEADTEEGEENIQKMKVSLTESSALPIINSTK